MTWNPPGAGILWMVSGVLIVAAAIDGFQGRIPNWLTFPFALGGLAFSLAPGGITLLESLGGLMLGLALLLPLYAIGGMGAGGVKLLAAMGAWVGLAIMFCCFLTAMLTSGVIGFVMMVKYRVEKARNRSGAMDCLQPVRHWPGSRGTG